MAATIAENGLPSPRISLWRRFTAIAQPYFFPHIPGGGKITFLLLIMLLVFLFGSAGGARFRTGSDRRTFRPATYR